MGMTDYAFATTWVLEASIERVWQALGDVERWREWFPLVRAVRLVEPGDADGAGAVGEITVRGTLPYGLTMRIAVTRVEAPRLLELTSLGDLDGWGRWTLAEEAGITTTRFEWRVTTTKAWMNALAPVARPAFAWNHDVAMTAAGRGLARHLGVRLLANDSGPVERDRSARTFLAVAVAVLLATAVLARRGSGRA